MDGSAVLCMRGVCKSFPSARGPVDVLRDVTLSVHRGDFVAVTGPSGSGKTTLAHLCALLDRPTSGSLLFDEQDVSAMDEQQRTSIRKHKIGMVFQKFSLLPHRTARENVLFRFRYLDRRPDDAGELALAALARLGLAHVADRPARVLSGGEMQRVAIARAVAETPHLLIADEPTGNLDAGSAAEVMQCFRHLNREGITILMVTHNTDLLPYCNRHLLCTVGGVSEVAA